jgi:transcriptional regulator with XRE-family HTH domain
MTTGQQIKRARLKKGLIQQQLADLVGMNPHDISNLELDKRNPTEVTLRKIAQALGVEIVIYLGGRVAALKK